MRKANAPRMLISNAIVATVDLFAQSGWRGRCENYRVGGISESFLEQGRGERKTSNSAPSRVAGENVQVLFVAT